MCVWSTLRSHNQSHNQSLAPALLHAWVLLCAQGQPRRVSWFRAQALSRAQDLLGEPYPLSMRVSVFVRAPRRLRGSWYRLCFC